MTQVFEQFHFWFWIIFYIVFITLSVIGLVSVILDTNLTKSRLKYVEDMKPGRDLDEHISKIESIIMSSQQLNLQTSKVLKRYEKDHHSR